MKPGQKKMKSSYPEQVIHVQEVVGVHASIEQHLVLQRADAPVCQLIALVRLHYIFLNSTYNQCSKTKVVMQAPDSAWSFCKVATAASNPGAVTTMKKGPFVCWHCRTLQ